MAAPLRYARSDGVNIAYQVVGDDPHDLDAGPRPRGRLVAPAPTGRYLADRIPNARFVELAGEQHLPWLGDAEAFCVEVQQFVTGVGPEAVTPGVVRAILQCDIEGSTVLARELGNDDGPMC